MSDEKKPSSPETESLISDLVVNADSKGPPQADLVVDPAPSSETSTLEAEIEHALQETELAVLSMSPSGPVAEDAEAWRKARLTVEGFRPVPWFIWRLSNYVLGKSGQINPVSEGLVLGLRRLIFAAASDSTLGSGRKINSIREALAVLPPDIIAAVSVMHAICRRLATRQHERIWRPILEDAILRAQIGLGVGRRQETFGAGRGMLAGFAGRVGLVILIATGTLDQARRSLEALASGQEISDVGQAIYGTDPLRISAMTLSASGCGREAAFGIVSYASEDAGMLLNDMSSDRADRRNWLAAFAMIEALRSGKSDLLEERYWTALNYHDLLTRQTTIDQAKAAARRGHSWPWMI